MFRATVGAVQSPFLCIHAYTNGPCSAVAPAVAEAAPKDTA